ncbi:UDPglucose 6-dehydrogenase [Pullulanibacillus pueri]|uniref:UDP-glucose 6-dehydrogenase n=1 Tax=Pullulanibacillus pueri TaxID=1437324 RepID=A0A8J2ZSV7_9BACL|nr:UDP-glucose/GDP-mannose dehydrogenase family protein [Pullulanibacillus pueri]MBM7681894.1 UDPglucose 6-dehydrogenase [Pullulanibacillus pueri]GGH76500.1 UDP-glucose 6-dehydrogenase [Pullulanibacillus pueri]
MNIVIVGTGYVGLVSGSCFADKGHHVYCVDNNQSKIKDLKNGIIPIYEKGLKSLIDRNTANGHLEFTTSLKDAVGEADFIFIAVGTPEMTNGEANLEYVYHVADELSEVLDDTRYRVIVDKSTVPIGTAYEVRKRIARNIPTAAFDVCSVPEFLKEGSAVHDTLHPDRIVIGTDSEKAQKRLVELHRPFSNQLFVTDIRSAEMIKYASNCFLATKISFINEIANLCDAYGADIKEVAAAMGLDKRISPHFLNAGLGYGGSCFPKDIKALINMADQVDYDATLLKAVQQVNTKQKYRVISHLHNVFDHELAGKKIGILGLAFKPNTDDFRESPSLFIIHELVKQAATVVVYDPVVGHKARLPDKVEIMEEVTSVFDHVDAVVLMTEWPEFIHLPYESLKHKMRTPVVIDGRNALDPVELKNNGFIYHGIGVR